MIVVGSVLVVVIIVEFGVGPASMRKWGNGRGLEQQTGMKTMINTMTHIYMVQSFVERRKKIKEGLYSP
jgi:hypothetical protein